MFETTSAVKAIRAYVLPILALLSATAWSSPTVSRFDGGFDDAPSDVVTDAMGNAYVVAAIESIERKREFAVLKYDVNGALRWKATYSNSLHSADGGAAYSVALDAQGNVYAVGMIYKQLTLFTSNVDWLVVSYTPEGIERWSHRIDGTAHDRDSANSVGVDAIGNVYVSGVVVDSEHAGQAGWSLIKYSSNGVPLWRRTDVRNDGTRDLLGAMRFDSAGNVVCTGTNTSLQPSMQNDIVAAKLDANGNMIWRRTFTDTAQSDDIIADTAMDAAGNIYITGETVPSTNPELVHVPITLKYDAAGNLQFVLRGDGAGGSSVAVDAVGDVVVSGTSLRESGQTGLAAISKYDASGVRRWIAPSVAGQVSIDSVGFIYSVATIQLFTANRSDVETVKLNRDGVTQWTHRYDASLTVNGSADWAIGGTVDSFDNFVTLVHAEDGINEDVVLLRYAANVAPTPPPASIAAPTNLSASALTGRVSLSWRDNSTNESGFSIERCKGSTCTNFSTIGQAAANTTSFNDTSVSSRTTYRYRLRAVRDTATSPYSNNAAVTTGKR